MSKKNRSKSQASDTGSQFPGLTPKQAAAVYLVAAGVSNPDAAEELGVDRATMWRWTQKEVFQAAVNAVQLDAREALQRGLIARVPRALAELERLLSSDSDSVRLRAALAIIDRARDTEIGYADAISILRVDAKRLHPNPFENLHLMSLADALDQSPEAEQRRAYVDSRKKELGFESEEYDA